MLHLSYCQSNPGNELNWPHGKEGAGVVEAESGTPADSTLLHCFFQEAQEMSGRGCIQVTMVLITARLGRARLC